MHLLVTDPTIKLGNLFYRLARKNRSQTYMTRALEVFKSVVRIDREDAYSRVAMGILEYERLPDPYVVFERSVRARSARIFKSFHSFMSQ